MAGKTYIGVDGLARRVKKAYIGVNGVARKIKKMYIGVNGVARCIFGSTRQVTYSRKVSDGLSNSRFRLAATTIENNRTGVGYALFAGGMQYATSTEAAHVDCIDKSLTKISASPLTYPRFGLDATEVHNYVTGNFYALFAGGHKDSTSTNYSTIDTYTDTLTHSSSTISLSRSRYDLVAATIGTYAFFCGGSKVTSSGAWTHYDTVDVYGDDLTRHSPTSLTVGRDSLAAAVVGTYILFAGGYTTTEGSYDTIDIYNRDLTKIATTCNLSVARHDLAATRVGNYAVFGGGYKQTTCNTVDAYDNSLTRSIPTGLSVARSALVANTLGYYFAVFAGGGSTVDAYDENLSRSIPTGLSISRSYPATAMLENYSRILFAGGADNVDIDVYAMTEV